MYVKDDATILANSLRILGGILSRPVVLFAFRPLNVDTTLLTGIGENLNYAHRNELNEYCTNLLRILLLTSA